MALTLRSGVKQLLTSFGLVSARENDTMPVDVEWRRGVFCPIVGGLANQLICYRVGRMLADLHRVPLVVDLSHFRLPKARPMLVQHFSPVIDIILNDNYSVQRYGRQARDLLSEVTVRGTPEFWLPSVQSLVRQRFLEGQTTPLLVDLWAGLAFQIQARDHYREPENAWKVFFKLECLEANERLFLGGVRSSENSIAVHVRRTDFAHHDGGLLVSAEQYNNAIALIESRVGDCDVFVFSDDQGWCRKWIRARSEIRYSPVSGEENGHKDMFIASQCRHKVLTSESTFSQLIDAMSPYGASDRILVKCSSRLIAPVCAEFEHA